MKKWGVLRELLDGVEKEIKQEVLALGKTQDVDGVRASYGNGRKAYDYEAIARLIGVTDDEIKSYSHTVVDWKKIVDDLNASDAVREMHCKSAR